jgi:hypothetical protein
MGDHQDTRAVEDGALASPQEQMTKKKEKKKRKRACAEEEQEELDEMLYDAAAEGWSDEVDRVLGEGADADGYKDEVSTSCRGRHTRALLLRRRPGRTILPKALP